MSSKQKDNFHFFMLDIILSLSSSFEQNLLSRMSSHLIVKEATRDIFMDEVKKEKPEFTILNGCLIVQNVFLRQTSQIAYQEALEVLPALAFCFRKDHRKTVKRLSSEAIFRIFANLYYEFFIVPPSKEQGGEEVDRFKKYFSRDDLSSIVAHAPYNAGWILEHVGFKKKYGNELEQQINEMLDEFYKES